MKIKVTVDNQTFEVEVGDINAKPVTAVVDGETFEVWLEETTPEVIETRPMTTTVVTPRPTPTVKTATPVITTTGASVNAPIPGVIVSITVKAGQSVTAGQELLVLEAMKMKNVIRSTRAGSISAIHVNVGDLVKHGQPLVEYSN